MNIDNLYQHADGDFYCLMSNEAALKNPADGKWLEAVFYIGTDGKMRATEAARWKERFTPVAGYDGEDEAVLSMIRRTNPGLSELDYVKVFESWHDTEINLTSEMLTMAVGACLLNAIIRPSDGKVNEASVTITTEDLHTVSQNYDMTRDANPHSFTFTIRK